jgi:hypothetical protein
MRSVLIYLSVKEINLVTFNTGCMSSTCTDYLGEAEFARDAEWGHAIVVDGIGGCEGRSMDGS